MSDFNNSWARADDHFGHTNILELCKRPFPTIQDMADVCIANHNALVEENDTVHYLGDFAFRCSAEYAVECLRRMNGKFKMVMGNHDKPLRQALSRGLLNKEISSGKLTIIGSTDPQIATSYTLNLGGEKFFLSHYSHRTWPGAFRGCIHLFAHSHNNLSPLYKSFDIGVDTNQYYPYRFSRIMEMAKAVTESFSEREN